ncbi:MAG: hypothetical protein NVS2B7_20310 [Herpetosiphon sp.]
MAVGNMLGVADFPTVGAALAVADRPTVAEAPVVAARAPVVVAPTVPAATGVPLPGLLPCPTSGIKTLPLVLVLVLVAGAVAVVVPVAGSTVTDDTSTPAVSVTPATRCCGTDCNEHPTSTITNINIVKYRMPLLCRTARFLTSHPTLTRS